MNSKPGSLIFSLTRFKNSFTDSFTLSKSGRLNLSFTSLAKSLKAPAAFPTNSITPRIALLKISFFLINSSRHTNHSPMPPVTVSIPPPRSSNPPNNGTIALNIAEKACFTISRIANNPLNVFFRFLDADSLSFR